MAENVRIHIRMILCGVEVEYPSSGLQSADWWGSPALESHDREIMMINNKWDESGLKLFKVFTLDILAF